jgi:transcription initiation protein SPT3
MAESRDNKAYKYRQEISQMMYVSGETAEPPVETTSIIEDIVRQQVIELVR